MLRSLRGRNPVGGAGCRLTDRAFSYAWVVNYTERRRVMVDLLTVGFTAGGFVTGAAGLIVAFRSGGEARRANLIAKDALERAERANELSEGSNVIANESNRIAVGANDLAEEANAISRRSESRATERNDVVWEGDWPTAGAYVMTNTGQDEALNVRIIVTIEGEEAEVRRDHVPPRDVVRVPVPGASKKVAHKMRELNAQQRRTAGSWIANLPHGLDTTFYVWERVTWETPLGQHHVYESQGSLWDITDLRG